MKKERTRTAFFSGFLCFLFTLISCAIGFLAYKQFDGLASASDKVLILTTIYIGVLVAFMAVSAMIAVGFGLRYIWKNKGFATIFTLLFVLCTGTMFAQGIAVRSNLAADALGYVNAGIDLTLNDQTTVCISGVVGKSFLPLLKKTFAVGGQVECRHWFSHQPYEDFFCGVTATPAIYQMTRKGTQHNGFAIPVGFNFGYSWPINRQLNLEASYGAGIIGYTETGGRDNRGNIFGKSIDKNYYLDFSTTNFNIGVTYILK